MATNTIICGLDTLEGRKFFRQSLFRLYSKWETLNEETSEMEQDIIIKRAYINCTSLNDLKDNILYKILCDDNNLGLTDNKGAFSMYRSYDDHETSILYMPNKIKINNRYLKSFLTDVKEDEVIMSFEGQNAAKFRISFGRIENDGYGNREIVWDNPIYFNDGINNSNAELLELIAKKEDNYEVAAKIELNNGVKKTIKASKLTKIEIIEYEHNYGDNTSYFIGWDENKREFTSGATIPNDILNFIDLNNPDEQREFQPGEVNFIGSNFKIEAGTGTSYEVQETIPIQFFQPYKWGRQSYFVENLEILPGDLAVVFWEKDLNQYVYLEQGDNEKFGYVCFGPSGNPKIETIHYIEHYDHLNFYLTPDENKTKPLMILSREQEASGGWYAIYNNPYTIGLIDYFANNPILNDSLQNFILQKNQEKNIYSLNDYFKFVSLEDKSYAESNEEIVFGYIPKIMVGAGTTIDILTEPQPYYFLSDPSWKDKKGSIIYAPKKIKPTGTTHYLRLPFLINNHFNTVNLVHHIINNKTPKTIWNVTVQKDTTVNKYDAKWTVLNEDETETIETNITASDKAFNRIKIGTPLEITNITYADHHTGISSRKVYSNYDDATVLLRGNLASWTAVYTIDSTTIKRVNYQILDSNNNVVQSGYTYDNSLHIPNVNYKVRLIGVPKDNTSYIEYSNPTVITINNNSPSPEIKANKKEFFFFSTKLKVNGEEKPSGVSDIKFTLKKGTTTLEENRQTISNYRIEKDSTINYTLETTTSKFYEDVADQTFNGNQNQNFILETSTTEKPVPKIIWSFDQITKKLTFRKEVPESFPTLNYTVTSEYLGTPKQITDSDKSYTIQVKPQDVITLTFSRPMTGIYPKFEETITFSASWESGGVQKDSVVL